MYSINFTVTNNKFSLSLYQDGANSYSLVNGTEIYKFKVKDTERFVGPICLGNISKDWLVDHVKSIVFTAYIYGFSVDYYPIVVDDIKDIQKYLMKKRKIV